MRVLIAYESGIDPYVDDLAAALMCEGIDVAVSLRTFWPEREGCDVVHVQWPEGPFQK